LPKSFEGERTKTFFVGIISACKGRGGWEEVHSTKMSKAINREVARKQMGGGVGKRGKKKNQDPFPWPPHQNKTKQHPGSIGRTGKRVKRGGMKQITTKTAE